MESKNLGQEEWIAILLPYLPVLEKIGQEAHDYYHREQNKKSDSSKKTIKKNNYGPFTCKS